MIEYDYRKILFGIIFMIFFFTIYERFTNPHFLISIGLSGISERNTGIIMNFISPLIIVGMITFVLFYMFGVNPITAFMVALTAFIAYFLFTSPVFFSILGLSISEQTKAINWMDYLRPIFVTGIILIALAVLLQKK